MTSGGNSTLPRQVHIREVGPRDGFQNEPETIATEGRVSMFHEMGVQTGLDLGAVIDAARAAQAILGRKLTSHSIVAGPVTWARPPASAPQQHTGGPP
jgi:isopropylmalate/homocitrate/citramalate synthase